MLHFCGTPRSASTSSIPARFRVFKLGYDIAVNDKRGLLYVCNTTRHVLTGPLLAERIV